MVVWIIVLCLVVFSLFYFLRPITATETSVSSTSNGENDKVIVQSKKDKQNNHESMKIEDISVEELDKIIQELEDEPKAIISDKNIAKHLTKPTYSLKKTGEDKIQLTVFIAQDTCPMHREYVVSDCYMLNLVGTEDFVGLISNVSILGRKVSISCTHVVLASGCNLNDYVMINPHVMANQKIVFQTPCTRIQSSDYTMVTKEISTGNTVSIVGETRNIVLAPDIKFNRVAYEPKIALVCLSNVDRFIISGSIITVGKALFVASSVHKYNKNDGVVVCHRVYKHNTEFTIKISTW